MSQQQQGLEDELLKTKFKKSLKVLKILKKKYSTEVEVSKELAKRNEVLIKKINEDCSKIRQMQTTLTELTKNFDDVKELLMSSSYDDAKVFFLKKNSISVGSMCSIVYNDQACVFAIQEKFKSSQKAVENKLRKSSRLIPESFEGTSLLANKLLRRSSDYSKNYSEVRWKKSSSHFSVSEQRKLIETKYRSLLINNWHQISG